MKMFDIFLYQMSARVGDLVGNFEKITKQYDQAVKGDCKLFVTPEMSLCGYPCADLWLKKSFIHDCYLQTMKLVKHTKGKKTIMCFGTPWQQNDKLFNAYIIAENGTIKEIILKQSLPNYSVFDEQRYFTSFAYNAPLEIFDTKICFMICEDVWVEENFNRLVDLGGELFIIVNASPFYVDVVERRRKMLLARTKKLTCPLMYLNLVGAHDEIVFDGTSMICEGKQIEYFDSFKQQSLIVSVANQQIKSKSVKLNQQQPEKYLSIYNAMLVALRDYLEVNNFKRVVLGLSGGVDSALTCVVACDALGAKNVHAIMLKTKFTSELSLKIAKEITKELTCEYKEYNIDGHVENLRESQKSLLGQAMKNTTYENLQARVRGLLLMSVANDRGTVLLTTGNKSENAVGYATLYGDMCGAYNPIKDLYKTEIFKICRWRNENHSDLSFLPNIKNIFSEALINRPPSAELAFDQQDEKALLPYDKLDQLLKMFIENDLTPQEVIANNFPYWQGVEEDAKKIYRLFINSEFKRSQSAPGPKISKKALGCERRYVISQNYK